MLVVTQGLALLILALPVLPRLQLLQRQLLPCLPALLDLAELQMTDAQLWGGLPYAAYSLACHLMTRHLQLLPLLKAVSDQLKGMCSCQVATSESQEMLAPQLQEPRLEGQAFVLVACLLKALAALLAPFLMPALPLLLLPQRLMQVQLQPC